MGIFIMVVNVQAILQAIGLALGRVGINDATQVSFGVLG